MGFKIAVVIIVLSIAMIVSAISLNMVARLFPESLRKTEKQPTLEQSIGHIAKTLYDLHKLNPDRWYKFSFHFKDGDKIWGEVLEETNKDKPKDRS